MRRTLSVAVPTAAAVLFSFTTFTPFANGDLVITLSPDSSGGTNLVLEGSGTLLDDGFFVYEILAETFYLGDDLDSDFSITPSNPIVAGGEIVNFFATTANAGATAGQSIQWNVPDWTIGGDLSTANGQVFNLDEIPFARLNPGSYALTRFDSADVADVGLVTLNVVVPEPTSLLVLGILGGGAAFKRRPRHTPIDE